MIYWQTVVMKNDQLRCDKMHALICFNHSHKWSLFRSFEWLNSSLSEFDKKVAHFLAYISEPRLL